MEDNLDQHRRTKHGLFGLGGQNLHGYFHCAAARHVQFPDLGKQCPESASTIMVQGPGLLWISAGSTLLRVFPAQRRRVPLLNLVSEEIQRPLLGLR